MRKRIKSCEHLLSFFSHSLKTQSKDEPLFANTMPQNIDFALPSALIYQYLLSACLLLIFALPLAAQKIDLSLKFNASFGEYEIYAKPNFNKTGFLLGAGSQITILVPSQLDNKPLVVKSASGGSWFAQQPIYAPQAFIARDFHTFVSRGGSINCQKGMETRLFNLVFPSGYDSKEVRLFVSKLDPQIGDAGMQGKNLSNYLPNELSLTDFYRTNYGIRKNIKGYIKDWRGAPMEGVRIKVANQTVESLYDGRYEFPLVIIANETNFYFKKDIYSTAGITTLDIITLQQHLSGKKTFEHPYQWIAADLDDSGTITQKDIDVLKEITNGNNGQNRKNTGWKFIPTDWLKKEKLYKKHFGESILFNHAERVFNLDFTAIKMGDIDGSYTLKSRTPTNIPPSPRALTIKLLNIELKAGEKYSIPFSTEELKKLTGYQLAIKVNNAFINGVKNVIGSQENLNLEQLSNGVISTNWYKGLQSNTQKTVIEDNITANSHQSAKELIVLEITPNSNGWLSDFLTLLDKTTATEAYDTDSKVMKIQLLFRKAPEEKGQFELYQNRPNPFREKTSIGYFLPKDSPVTLTLRNEAGETVKVMKEDGKAGFNSFNLMGNEVTKGLIYFQMETKYGAKTLKMLHLN